MHGTLLDVVYDPRPTKLMQAWRQQGGIAIGGEQMLLYQAMVQVWLMTGIWDDDPPSGMVDQDCTARWNKPCASRLRRLCDGTGRHRRTGEWHACQRPSPAEGFEVLLITGMSGAGRSHAADSIEDMVIMWLTTCLQNCWCPWWT